MTGHLPDDVANQVVGRRTELRLLLSAIEQEKAVLLLGLPGVSKTTMVRAVAGHLGDEPDRFVDVTGDEQLTAQALVGGFDPPMVIKEGYRPEHFVPGPLVRAMTAGGVLFVEELNRAPSGALNVLMTVLSERYLEVPRLGRIDAQPGFSVIGAANPLDDVGTARISRGLAERFLQLELHYQERDEELAIVGRRSGPHEAGFHAFAVDVARESRKRADLRYGASVRGAIDFADLLASWGHDDLDLDTLRLVGCSAYAGKLRVKPTAGKSACEIVHELIDAVLRRDYEGRLENLLEQAKAAPMGQPVEAATEDREGAGEKEGEVAAGSGDSPPAERPERPDEIPGLTRPGSSTEPGDSRAVPMVDRDRPAGRGARRAELTDRDTHLRDLDSVLQQARELVVRLREGVPAVVGAPGSMLRSEPWTTAAHHSLDVDGTIEAFAASGGYPAREDFRVLSRGRHVRNYVILVDHSGSMVGQKLELAATMAAALAQLSFAGHADYGVIAFDEELKDIKPLGEPRDVEQVVDRILRLPEGRATDLGKVLGAAAEASEQLPEATDVILISDCMPTRGVKTFNGLARLVASIPSLYICFTEERSAAIRIYHGERQLDIYEWWAQQWVGEGRFQRFGEPEDIDGVVDLLSTEPHDDGPMGARKEDPK